MPLSTEWTRKCEDEEDKKATEQAIRSAGPILQILKELLEETLRGIDRPTETDYASPSWSALQAHRNGRAQELTHVIKLLTLKD